MVTDVLVMWVKNGVVPDGLGLFLKDGIKFCKLSFIGAIQILQRRHMKLFILLPSNYCYPGFPRPFCGRNTSPLPIQKLAKFSQNYDYIFKFLE